MDVVIYLHAPATLHELREPLGPSKYDAKSAHTGEGLGLILFDVWTAVYVSSNFFRNVRPHQQFRSQKKESSATLLWCSAGNRNVNSRMSSNYVSTCIG